jgi:hypothetical protein
MKQHPFSLAHVVLATAALLGCSSAQTPVASRHLAALSTIPCDALRLTGGGIPDADGLVGHNRGGYRSPTFQRGAARLLIYGVVCRDQPSIDDAFRAIDVVFAHQDNAGHFRGDKTPSGVAFWLCELNQALLVLGESSFDGVHRARVQELIPKIHRAAAWLALPVNQERLKAADAKAPNRLLFDALAYGTSGLLCDDASLARLGRSFVDLALGLYRSEDGVFLEKNGHDSSYQAVSAWLLQVWALHFPDRTLEAVTDKAAQWVVDRIQSDGSVDVTGNTRTGLGQETWQGRVKDVNYPEVLRCLLYFVARRGDSKAGEAAKRLMAWMRKQKR